MAFHFKEFSVDDSACAMKVGTDSVLLGAWADFSGCSTILDVGTGSGLLALMAAQKCDATITAIDIDEDSCHQAEKNFSESSWSDRINCIHQGLEEYACNQTAAKARPFDHIITNPPYFINSLKSPDSGRNKARHNDGLPLKSLLEYSSLLLRDSGKLSIVFPYNDNFLLINQAREFSLNLSRQLIIIPKQGKEPNRILLEFTKAVTGMYDATELVTGNKLPTLTIRDGHGKYTQEYISFTERFYLKLS
jgi:tRNA1Val (adenine37-N6)-methyltransferase